MDRSLKRFLAVTMSIVMVICGMAVKSDNTIGATETNVANGRNNYTYMTSNANTGAEGFCYIGSGFSAINTCNEELGNGNNMLGQSATTSEVALYVDLGADYDISRSLVYQGSTNANYKDSYCTNYSIYYSSEEINKDNEGNITWNLAGTCENGKLYSGAQKSVTTEEKISSDGDSITFSGTYTARSVKVVFDKESCMGTGTGSGGTTGTVSILSFRVYGTAHETDEPSTSEPEEETTAEKIPAVDDSNLYKSKTTNIAQGKNGYSSSNNRNGKNYPVKIGNLTDGNTATSSFIVTHANDATPWFAVDLGSVKDINKVTVYSGASDSTYANSYPVNYVVQVAEENTSVSDNTSDAEIAKISSYTWRTVATVTDGTLDTKSITFPRQNTRWVRVLVSEKSNDYCSLIEMMVYETDDSGLLEEEQELIPTGGVITDPKLYVSNDENEATAGYASSNRRNSTLNPLKVNNLTDNNTTSFIVVNATETDTPWFVIDLGSVKDINKVKVVPGGDGEYSSCPIDYEIQVASEATAISAAADLDNFTWTTVKHITDGKMSTKSITFPRQNTRWIKLKANTSSSDVCCSLYEFMAYETDDSNELVDTGEATDILFIGNSMTYYNNLANVFESVANYKGHNVSCTAVTNGGQNLIYQSTATNVDNAVKMGGYEVVIIQDIVGSFNADNLKTGSDALIAKILQYNLDAKIVFYEPWPVKGSLTGEDSLLPYFTYYYLKNARDNSAILAPAGETFYDIYDKGYDYYCGDGKHPLPLGTFISCSTLYYSIFGEEAYADYTSTQLTKINKIINDNISDSNAAVTDYDLEIVNLINSKSYYYAHAVKDAVSDSTGNTKYVSVGGNYLDATDETTFYSVVIDGVEKNINEGGSIELGTATYGYYCDGAMYKPGSRVTINGDMTFTSVNTINVSSYTTASIRTIEPAGLRFKATIISDNTAALDQQGAIKEGILITTKDIYENNDVALSADSSYTKVNVVNSGWYSQSDNTRTYCASIVNVAESNYSRHFIARAYAQITYSDGSTTYIYSDTISDRCISDIAKAVINNNYEGRTDSAFIDLINKFAGK